MYAKGYYVRKDFAKAVLWFRKAANNGFSIAQFNLGVSFFKGEGNRRNDKEANRQIELAAMQGYGPAVEMRSWHCYNVSSKVEAALNMERIEKLKDYRL